MWHFCASQLSTKTYVYMKIVAIRIHIEATNGSFEGQFQGQTEDHDEIEMYL